MKKESNSTPIIIAIIAVCCIVLPIIILGSTFVSTYNSMVDMQENVKLAEANVETMMQNRLDLIPDLVKTVKAYSNHEEQVFADIANARAALSDSFDTQDPSKISEANQEVSLQINRLTNFVAENYPTLAAGEQYTALMDEISASVNKITNARVSYNEMVGKYNKKVKKFPGNILAQAFGFEEIKEFQADKAANNPNLVDFGD